MICSTFYISRVRVSLMKEKTLAADKLPDFKRKASLKKWSASRT